PVDTNSALGRDSRASARPIQPTPSPPALRSSPTHDHIIRCRLCPRGGVLFVTATTEVRWANRLGAAAPRAVGRWKRTARSELRSVHTTKVGNSTKGIRSGRGRMNKAPELFVQVRGLFDVRPKGFEPLTF